MDALRKHGFAILLGLSLLVVILVGVFWVFMNAKEYQGQASGLAKTAQELKEYARRKSDEVPTERLLEAYRDHRDAMAAAAEEAASYLDRRMAQFRAFWGEKTPPEASSFMSNYNTEVDGREKAYRAKFPLKNRQGEDIPVLQKRRTSVADADLPLAMKELYMFLAVADAALGHEIGGLAVEFVYERKAQTPTSPEGEAAPLYDVVKATVICQARWPDLCAFLDELYADDVVPFELTRLVVGKTYESLQQEVVKQATFDTKEKAAKDPGVGPDPALDVLKIDLVGYDWKGEQLPAAEPAGQ
ncbi:MAG: hypothetical protein JXP34_21780 [Planctomycetes bacterium]|nr:hypothetical protein [Planctomycetota bacterium]